MCQLTVLVEAITKDIDLYLDSPAEYYAPDYFESVGLAAQRARDVLVWLQGAYQ